MNLIDLHCHSTCSDGTDPPGAVAALAAARGLSLFALTDHDTCAGFAEAAAVFPGLIRATELSCDDDGQLVHILAFDTGGAWDQLDSLLQQMPERRRQRLRQIAEQLQRRGVNIDVEPILAAAGERPVGRPDLARALREQGLVSTEKEAFQRYLYDGGPGDAPGHRLPLAEALAIGKAAGAKMALAHPHLSGDQRAARTLRRYRQEGLDGLEAFYGTYPPDVQARWTQLADELGLVCTAGSDRHHASDLELGLTLPPARAQRLKDWLGR
ncbi:MAG: PHP domain-containing protein [Deltaproteobacteria bacterium]|jgi:predicted metal-dependent phosphoesterase TrpH|nr:PHP domain-containing protein [Deltaproteobacteria bacterium]